MDKEFKSEPERNMSHTTYVDNRMLLIVDPQVDFITGSLPVAGSVEAMDKLADYIKSYGVDYKYIVVTCDHHGLRHSSFTKYGGKWPIHCIKSSVGAAIWPTLMKRLKKYPDKVHILYKGDDDSQDEYSIFQNERSREFLDGIIKNEEIEEIDICGLAGDVCVANTYEDAKKLYPGIHYRLLKEFTASLDGGKYLENLKMD